MSVEQRQEELARRRSNYRQNKDKGKQVQTCGLYDIRTMMSFQDLKNANFASRFYQRAHDNEDGPSTTYVSRVPSTDQNFTYLIFQQNDNHEARPFIRNIDDNDCGVHVNESLIAIGHAIYTSRAQGVIYHKIGGFHPNQGSRPRYLQLYIYDTDHELQNRMRENPILNQAVVKRDMIQRYQDGMAIVLNNGKPDIFLTMTCNPSWIEITSEVGLHQTPQDRPDVLTRIFRSKFDQLKDDVINKGVLGRVKSYMYVTEFQKHGLPHVYRLLILDTDDKLREPEEYDSVVKAEIPRHEYFFCHTLTDSLSEVNHNFQ
ncbi:hypothetical protein KIW84_035128 [Lathyrus oleraceus]|uniref:Helitron helicase-like domain-containing protein n=1 Tax=Pisum sativum TaxID=3888 RepID=A0A9D4Y1E2_PEA|nr:hypothetical protein KIW84_035128 [Pisum sativum]